MMEFFLNCDWGTSRFRLRLVEVHTGSVLAERKTGEGVSTLFPPAELNREQLFRDVLDRNIQELQSSSGHDLTAVPVVISGMASSTLGWRELPYARLPISLDGTGLHVARLDEEEAGDVRPVFLISGVCTEQEVMRGEEIELIGVSVFAPDRFQNHEVLWIILPGTHSKHVKIRNRRIVDFHTRMTGELYQLLGQHSSLRHRAATSLPADFQLDSPGSSGHAAFLEGVNQARNHGLGGSLFQVRTRQVLHQKDPIETAAFLSGLLIGDELQSLCHENNSNEPIILAASGELSRAYQIALEELGQTSRVTVISPHEVDTLSARGQWKSMQNFAPQLTTATDQVIR